MAMDADLWNALSVGDVVRECWSEARWRVVSTKPCPPTFHGYTQVCTLERILPDIKTDWDGFGMREEGWTHD